MTRFRSALLAASMMLATTPAAALAQTSASYSYDALGRLTATSYPSGASTTYSYDAADNRSHLTTNTSSSTGLAAANLTATVAASQMVAIAATSSATNPTNTALTVAQVDAPAKGNATVSGGTITYTAAPGQSGTDRFRYTLADGRGGRSTAFVTVTISTTCAAPAPQSSAAGVAYDSVSNALPLSLGGSVEALTLVTGPAHGTASVNGAAISYTPQNGYSGSDNLSFQAGGCGATSAPATVSITVQPDGVPTVGPAGLNVASNSSAALTLAPSGTWTSLAIASPPAHGAATFHGPTVTYTPSKGYVGSDAFTYTAAGPGGSSAPAQVSVTVYGGGGQLSAALSQTTYVATQTSPGVWNAPTALTVSAKGGSGAYTYAWSLVDGDGATTISDPASRSVQWTRSANIGAGPWSSTWRCVVTDSSGKTVATNTVAVMLQ